MSRSKSLIKPIVGAVTLTFVGCLLCRTSSSRAQIAGGDLDPTFGIGGKVTTKFHRSLGLANAVVIQADGKIMAMGGASSAEANEIALVQYNTDGSLDPTFGTNGKATTGHIKVFGPFQSFATQSDGKIVVAGHARSKNASENFALVRLKRNGKLDPTFGNDGKLTTDFSQRDDQAYALAIQPDDKIVAAGYTNTGQPAFALARYEKNGKLDRSFGNRGRTITRFFDGVLNRGSYAYALAIQPDGKIIAAGFAASDVDPIGFALARYNTDGSLDSTFDMDGRVTTSFPDRMGRLFDNGEVVDAVVIQPDGKIVSAGYRQRNGLRDFALARYSADGGLDPTFGIDGKVTTDLFGEDDWINAIAIQTNGKLVAAGLTSINKQVDFALVRYNTDGSLDTSFGTGGKITTDFLGGQDTVRALAIQSDDKIVAAGFAFNTEFSKSFFALARYEGDGGTSTIISQHPTRCRASEPCQSNCFRSGSLQQRREPPVISFRSILLISFVH